MKKTPAISQIENHTPLAVVVAVAALLGAASSVPAATVTYTWNTAATVNPAAWSSGTCWSGGTAPTTGGSLDYAIKIANSQHTYPKLDFSGVFKLNRMDLSQTASNKYLTVSSSAGSTLEFVKDSNGVLPILSLNSSTASGGGLTLSVPFTVTDQLTITNAGTNSGNYITKVTGAITNNGGIVISGAKAFTFSSVISGAGGITLGTTTNQSLSGLNTYTGATTVQSGTLSFATVGAGATAQGLGENNTVYLNAASGSAGALQYTGAAGTLDKAIQVQGAGLNSIQNAGTGLLTLSGGIVNNGTVVTLSGGTYGLKLTGTISGSGAGSNVAVTTGSVTLGSVNTYGGSTLVYGGGILVNGVAEALPTATALTLGSAVDNSNGTFDLNGGDQTVASLDSAGSGVKTVTNNGAVLATLTVNNGGTYGGGIADGIGKTALTIGGGHLVLAGANSYTGATGVLSGAELTVDGSLGNTAVTVNSGATLGGTGSISGGVTVTSGTVNGTNLSVTGQTVFTGASTLAGSMTSGGGIHVSTNGALNVTGHTTSDVSVNSAMLHGTGSVGNVVLTSGTLNGSLVTKAISGTGLVSPGESGGILTATSVTSTVPTGLLSFAFELTANSTNYGNAANSVNDILHITSSNGLTLDAGTSVAIYFDSLSAGAKYDGGFFVDSMSIADLEAAIANTTFTFYVKNAEGLTEFNGNNYSLASSQVSISAISVDLAPFAGDSVSGAELEFTVVPEPGTWAMMVGGLGALIGFRRLTGRSRIA